VVVPVIVSPADVTLSVTFGTNAPAGSLTYPSMPPVVSWLKHTGASIDRKSKNSVAIPSFVFIVRSFFENDRAFYNSLFWIYQ
jgi:hypothetical protein